MRVVAAASRYRGLSSRIEAQKLAIRSAVTKKNSSAPKVRLTEFDLSFSILTPPEYLRGLVLNEHPAKDSSLVLSHVPEWAGVEPGFLR